VSISYVSDWFVQERGVSLDDVRVLADGGLVSETSFEDGFGGWAVAPPPADSAQANSYVRSNAVYDEGAVVTTDDTVFTGFGVEGITSPAMREDFLSRALGTCSTEVRRSREGPGGRPNATCRTAAPVRASTAQRRSAPAVFATTYA
jgi:hypothetical protein